VAERIRLIKPGAIEANPENPRLIFRAEELAELETSIADQGILVPLTVYQDGRRYVLLDGERRWRCAIKLGLTEVPAIVQPKPDRLQNIMMMFAIHNTRRDWDPLPAALKLEQLESEFAGRQSRPPTETELAGLASISRGEVRRLRNILRLPKRYRDQLLRELEKPRADQLLTVDHVLEATRGSAALEKRGVIDVQEADRLSRAVIRKFRNETITNTVAPRKLARMARAVERDELSRQAARRAVKRLIEDDAYTIDDAFEQTVARADWEFGSQQLANRLENRLLVHRQRRYDLGDSLRETLERLQAHIARLLRS